MSIKSGPYGDPPRTARRDYFVVLLLLLWRMRDDLLLLAVIGALILSDTVPTNWQQSGSVVSIMGITVSIFIGFRIAIQSQHAAIIFRKCDVIILGMIHTWAIEHHGLPIVP